MGRLAVRSLGRPTESAQRGADRALGFAKSLPDPVRRGIAHSAVQIPKRLDFIAALDGLLQEFPQGVGGQPEPFDLVGRPDAERPSAAARPLPVIAEDPPGADRFLPRMLLVITSQNAVPDEGPDSSAMRASRCFELGIDRLELRGRFAKPPAHCSPKPPEAASPKLDYNSRTSPGRHVRAKEVRGGVFVVDRRRGAGCGIRLRRLAELRV